MACFLFAGEAAPIAASLPPVRHEGCGALQRKNFGRTRFLRLSEQMFRAAAQSPCGQSPRGAQAQKMGGAETFCVEVRPKSLPVSAPARVAGIGQHQRPALRKRNWEGNYS